MDITLDDRLNVLQQISQKKLVEILDVIPGSKDLVIEQKLMKILDTFVGITVLKRYGVDKVYKLEVGLKPSNTQRVFLISSDLITCKRVLDQIQSEISQTHKSYSQPCHHLLVTPFVPAILHSLLEEEGLAELVSLHSMSWEFVRFDGNVLSLENPMFVDLYYHKNTSLLPALARNLWSLQLVLGAPKQILTLGKHSQQTLKLIESMEQAKCLSSANVDNEIGTLIIMDRSYDLVTSLLTPVTYAALMHEVLEINVGIATSGKSQIRLDPDKDQIYGEVRDMPCSDVFPIIHGKAKSLKSEQEAIHTMKLAEMERYVATKLQKTRDATLQLAFHISACQTIADSLGSEFQTLQSVEKSILECRDRKECLNNIERNLDEHPLRSLRLLCLLSITSDGITQTELQNIQKLHLHAHGYHNIPLFYKLQTVGLMRCRSENILHKLPNWNSEWTTNANRLKLLPNSSKRGENKGRTCPSYVFSNAYVPAIAQIVSVVANQKRDQRSFEELQNLPGCALSGQASLSTPKTVVVCIVGGITKAEVSACRLVGKSTGNRLVLVSDAVVTGNKLIEGIQDI